MSDDTILTEAPASDSASTAPEGKPAESPAAAVAAAAAPEGVPVPEAKPQDEPAKPEGAPQEYEFAAPEGQAFDPSVLGAFSEVARELNLPQEAAQKVLDRMAPAIAARQSEQIEAARAAWADSAKTDKEFGGDRLTENLAVAKKALDQFGTPELKKLLNESGLGNNPEVIRAFYRAGKAISEDRVVTGGSSVPVATSSDARTLYPNSNLK